MRSVPLLCEFYPGICLTTEEKVRKNLSQGNNKYIISEQATNAQRRNRDIDLFFLYSRRIMVGG
jgi:hypothetical protein